jgi:hypothetical protein
METKVLNEHEVAAYLQQNPEFFENHADLLAVMHVPTASAQFLWPSVSKLLSAIKSGNWSESIVNC